MWLFVYSLIHLMTVNVSDYCKQEKFKMKMQEIETIFNMYGTRVRVYRQPKEADFGADASDRWVAIDKAVDYHTLPYFYQRSNFNNPEGRRVIYAPYSRQMAAIGVWRDTNPFHHGFLF